MTFGLLAQRATRLLHPASLEKGAVRVLEEVLETPAGRQLEELRCGPHQDEETRYWEANLLFERVSEQAGHPV
jgi:hypothetical protein